MDELPQIDAVTAQQLEAIGLFIKSVKESIGFYAADGEINLITKKAIIKFADGLGHHFTYQVTWTQTEFMDVETLVKKANDQIAAAYHQSWVNPHNLNSN